MILYTTKKKELNPITAMIGAEIRSAIQNWRKQNNLPIDYRIPTLKVYFKNPIIKTALIEGYSDVGTNVHLFETCLIDEVEFDNNVTCTDEADLYFWSPLGGNVGYCSPLKNNSKNIQKMVDETIEKKLYNEYA